jgi:hypothetical protein
VCVSIQRQWMGHLVRGRGLDVSTSVRLPEPSGGLIGVQYRE